MLKWKYLKRKDLPTYCNQGSWSVALDPFPCTSLKHSNFKQTSQNKHSAPQSLLDMTTAPVLLGLDEEIHPAKVEHRLKTRPLCSKYQALSWLFMFQPSASSFAKSLRFAPSLQNRSQSHPKSSFNAGRQWKGKISTFLKFPVVCQNTSGLRLWVSGLLSFEWSFP